MDTIVIEALTEEDRVTFIRKYCEARDFKIMRLLSSTHWCNQTRAFIGVSFEEQFLTGINYS